MKMETATILIFTALFACIVADRDNRQRDFESGGYLKVGGEFIDRSSNGDASVSNEGDGCDRNIDNSNEAYERDEPYEKPSHRVGYSSSRASAAASADASAKAYERGHTDRIFN